MKRSKFSLSNYKVLSCDGGYLVPVGLEEVLPGDVFQHRVRGLIRAAPMIVPVMHQVDARLHTWFVPFRLIWPEFEDFITGGPDGEDATVPPTIALTYTNPTTGTNIIGQLPDYLGVPPGLALTVSALPFRAYNLIWNLNYRDQDLQTARALSTASGVDATTAVDLARICWEKDNYTSARLEAQKGAALQLPLGDQAPIVGLGLYGDTSTHDIQNQAVRETDGGTPTYPFAQPTNTAARIAIQQTDGGATASPMVYADLSAATGVDAITLREFFALQRFQEARSRYGSEYVDYLRFLGVRPEDARLQRPEYLGGGKVPMQFSEVLQTAPNEGDESFTGSLAGHGIAGARANRYRRFFSEHGFVITLLSIRPRTMYVDGLRRLWSRTTREQFYQRELEHIGQQEILNKEIKAGHASPNGTFGYSDRYYEYRGTENTVAGEMRDTLNYWHMAREFSGDPALNSAFVTCTPTDRVFAGSAELIDQYYCMIHHSLQARRMLSKKSGSFIY